MTTAALRKLLWAYVVVLVPMAWLAAKFDAYGVDGDGVAYMDLADRIHSHAWAGVVNGYWHPLYPAFLAAGQALFHTTRWNELGAYYAVNVLIFFLEVGGMLLLTQGIVRLRDRFASGATSLLSADALRLLGLSMLLIATMRELTLGKVRTDSLLQALIFTAVGLLLHALAAEGTRSYVYALLMGLSLGLAYLTKSFAFPLTLLCVAMLVVFLWAVCRRRPVAALSHGVVAILCFGVVAGPYVAALSRQQGRFDFGDSGNLNYVWYISGTEKMHLQPRMTASFGSATVQLKHPEKEVMQSPGVYSYVAMPHGTYPPWFNPTYWNDRITPKFSLRLLLRRDVRNVVLIFRYLLNHPEPLLLLAVLLGMCASLRGNSRFAWPAAGLGVLIWAIYALVNVEERYVTAAFLLIAMATFAALKPAENKQWAVALGTALVVLFAVLPVGAAVREVAESRRQQSIRGLVPAWRDPEIFGAAEGLKAMGLKPGDQIGCIGTIACLEDHYWARLAGLQIITELYAPNPNHLALQLQTLPNRDRAFASMRAEGAKAVVGAFDPGEMNGSIPATANWTRLGDTHFYALRLDAVP